ncbi:MAG: diamine N-acetyltransferase [Clostridiales bacterium]|jgi:ribosomal protein S18 acetylase RimI-like enzyme|nr:diamine N-acetyltransferase [Clostridiales bacterium]
MIKCIEIYDLPACLDVIHKSFLTVAEESGLTKENAPTNGAYIPLKRLEDEFEKGTMMYGLYDQDKIVGFIQLKDKGDHIFEIGKLSVLPEYRHKGYGKMLLDFAKDKAIAAGGKVIEIGIKEDNLRLKDWYTQYGFVHTGTSRFPHVIFEVGFMALKL